MCKFLGAVQSTLAVMSMTATLMGVAVLGSGSALANRGTVPEPGFFGCDTDVCKVNTSGNCGAGNACPFSIWCTFNCRSNATRTACDCW